LKVAAATADQRGFLTVTFSDGSTLAAAPDELYENWELAGPGPLVLVAPPGGGDPRISS
jgi:hypothetical protein